jgi:hypothetical protein
MNRFKVVLSIICLCVATLVSTSAVRADEWNKKTVVTISQPIEIPGGIILPAGTYVFKLMDSFANRHIVQIFSEDQSRIFATILAIPNYRLRTTDKTVMTFGESVDGVPQAIRAWFYPGSNSGEEFVYPRHRAMELAKVTRTPILAMPDEIEAVITKPAKASTDEPIVTLRDTPLVAVNPTGDEVAIAQVVTPPPAQNSGEMPSASTMPAQPSPTTTTDNSSTVDSRDSNTNRLPQTASLVPLMALLGLLSLGAGCALWAIPKRTL